MQNKKLEEEIMNNLKKYAKIAAGGFLALTLVLGSYSTVGPGERGVMIVMGKTSTTVLNEGPHFKLPFISSIRTMSVRVQKSEDTSEAATKDMQKVQAKVALNWTINTESVGKMLREVGDESSIENNIIAPAVSEVLKAATAKMTAEEVLTRRMELKASIDEALIKRLTSYGLVIRDISLVDLDFTKEFNHAVEAKQIAEQEAKQAEYVALKATQDAKATVNTAKGQAESNLAIAKAEAEANLIKARAQAEGQKLLKENLTKEVLQLEYLKRWDGSLPSVLTGNGNGVMLNVPSSAGTKTRTAPAKEATEEQSE